MWEIQVRLPWGPIKQKGGWRAAEAEQPLGGGGEEDPD